MTLFDRLVWGFRIVRERVRNVPPYAFGYLRARRTIGTSVKGFSCNCGAIHHEAGIVVGVHYSWGVGYWVAEIDDPMGGWSAPCWPYETTRQTAGARTAADVVLAYSVAVLGGGLVGVVLRWVAELIWPVLRQVGR